MLSEHEVDYRLEEEEEERDEWKDSWSPGKVGVVIGFLLAGTVAMPINRIIFEVKTKLPNGDVVVFDKPFFMEFCKYHFIRD